jgi:N-acylglucosamine 2-epimerase
MLAGVVETYMKKYESELVDQVIPFWERNCIDHECGGFITCLDQEGKPYDFDKYMWMQWRIVYMFATLYVEYKQTANWLKIAQDGFEFLTKHGKAPDGSYYFALNRQGKPIVGPFNIFSEAFVVMGCAALFKATKTAKYKDEAVLAMNHYLSRIPNPKRQWEKSMPDKPKRLSLGPYMILANLGTIMKDCLGVSDFEKPAQEAIELVVDKFWNEDKKVLFENINTDYTFDLESSDGRHLNPGHGLESMWFVMQYAEQHGRPELISKAAMITKALLEFGWDKVHGGIFYFMDVLGKPHVELQWDMKLWWVHNEAILACLYAYRLTKDKFFWDWFVKLDEYSFTHFRDNQFGEWFAYLNRHGEPTHTLKGGRWKTFFHLPRCMLFGLQQLEKIKALP